MTEFITYLDSEDGKEYLSIVHKNQLIPIGEVSKEKIVDLIDSLQELFTELHTNNHIH